MPYNGAGVFTGLPTPVYPAVAGEFILADYFNQTMEDVFDGLSSVLTKDGQNAFTANISAAGFKLTNSGPATLDTDLLRLDQVLHGFTSTGFIRSPQAPASDDSDIVATTAWFQDELAGLGTASNYIGYWSTLTGAQTRGHTVGWLGGFYLLLQDVADITLIEPGTNSAIWAWLNPDRSLRNSLLWS